jgi:hypothetical protein
MNRARLILFLSLVLTAPTRYAGAQASPVDPMSLHVTGEMRCQSIAGPGMVHFDFHDGTSADARRHSMLLYDSAGTPLSGVINAHGKSIAGLHELHIVIAHFSPVPKGAYGVLTVNPADPEPPNLSPELPDFTLPDSIKTLPTGWRKATSDEIGRARNLALEFWKRRCNKDDAPASKPAGPPIAERSGR